MLYIHGHEHFFVNDCGYHISYSNTIVAIDSDNCISTYHRYIDLYHFCGTLYISEE